MKHIEKTILRDSLYYLRSYKVLTEEEYLKVQERLEEMVEDEDN